MSLDMDFIKNYYNWILSVRGLAPADLKELSYRNVHTDSNGNT